jgi:hypothetical protein
VTRRQFCLTTALTLASVRAFAHPGHAHRTMGVVSMIHENHLEVRDVKGTATTFTLDAKSRVRRGKTILKAADIKSGDRVIVVWSETKGKDGKPVVTVTEVQLGTGA